MLKSAAKEYGLTLFDVDIYLSPNPKNHTWGLCKATWPITAGNSTLALPEIVIKQLFRGYECKCRDCEPDLMQQMYNKVRRDLIES